MLKRLTASRKNPYIPGIDTPNKVQFDLSGSLFSVDLPPHSATDPLMKPETASEKINIFDQSQFVQSNLDFDPFKSLVILRRRWTLFGGIFDHGYIGAIDFLITVEQVDLPEGMSCFNPGHFEQIAIRNAYLSASPQDVHSGRQIVPVNWHEHKGQIVYERHPDLSQFKDSDDSVAGHFSSYMQVALDDRIYLQLVFSNIGYAPSRHAIKALNRVRDQVLSSIEFDLGDNAKKLQKSALHKAVKKEFAKKRNPEPWKYADKNNPGSPPPEFIL